MDSYDVIVIGSGPGGYVAAIRASQLGFKTALVEKNGTLGGTCLNIGCIPSKALLHSTEVFHFIRHQGKAHGFRVDDLGIDIPALMKKKDSVVKKLVGGVKTLVEKRDIAVLRGKGRLRGGGKVAIEGDHEASTVQAKHIILATGSVPVDLPFLKIDGERIVSSQEALEFSEVPGKLVVVGGGAIGLELGSVWARLGSAVAVVEFLPRIAPTFDQDVSKLAQRILAKQGLDIHTSTQVTGFDPDQGELVAEAKGKEVRFPADKILVCVGRKPFSTGLGLNEAGVKLDDKGRVEVDDQFRTSAEGVYAIGDLIRGPMLAHKAEEEGVACVERIAGQHPHINYEIIPNVIYTEPEIASAGAGEDTLRDAGHEVRVGKFPLQANGRALAADAAEGFVKVIADAKSDRVLGVQMIARGASEMIAAAVAHMEYGGSAEDIGRTCHAHPTLTESFKEAALGANGRAIHIL